VRVILPDRIPKRDPYFGDEPNPEVQYLVLHCRGSHLSKFQTANLQKHIKINRVTLPTGAALGHTY
jgi:hypothetical protein